MPARLVRRRFLAAAPVLLLTALLVATLMVLTTARQADAFTAKARSHRDQKVLHGLKIARNQVGDPYRYGADGPSAFDCSGLTEYAFKKVGLRLPRSSDAQYRHVRHIRKKNIKRGDLMFFSNGGGVYHVGIYLGRARDGRALMLHSPYPGQRVHRERVWTSHWSAGTLRLR